MDNPKLYLDYNSTTPLEPEVLSSITEALTLCYANPSSSHEEGVRAKRCIDKARSHVAAMIDAKDSDIIFTSGCTEANNMVIQSCVTHHRKLMKQEGTSTILPHIVTSNLEHGSVLKTARNLADDGIIELTVIKADPSCGHVLVEDIIGAIKPNTILVTVMLANNETGVVQPVKEISSALAALRKEQKCTYPFLHTDSAQACGKIPVSVSELNVDFLSIAGQKFYGPRMGALYVRDLENKLVPLYPLIIGAGQERGYRSGTENTAYMAGLGKASELVYNNLDAYHKHMKEIRDYLEKQLSVSLLICSIYYSDGNHRNNLGMVFILMEDFLVLSEFPTHVMSP